jgi:hypothetical protein
MELRSDRETSPMNANSHAHRHDHSWPLRPGDAALWRHLTSAGRGWSALGPAPGLQSWPSPDGGRGNNQLRLTYEQPRRHRPDFCIRREATAHPT